MSQQLFTGPRGPLQFKITIGPHRQATRELIQVLVHNAETRRPSRQSGRCILLAGLPRPPLGRQRAYFVPVHCRLRCCQQIAPAGRLPSRQRRCQAKKHHPQPIHSTGRRTAAFLFSDGRKLERKRIVSKNSQRTPSPYMAILAIPRSQNSYPQTRARRPGRVWKSR